MITAVLAFKWFIFAVTAILAIGSSLLMVTRKNPIHSALWLIVTFCSLAGIYVLLQATFIALAQVVIYAGAIMMLVIFVIMLIHLETGPATTTKRSFPKLMGGVITVVFFLLLLTGITAYVNYGKQGIYTTGELDAVGNTQAVGTVLYGKYVFAFEIASVLLLIGIIGAVVLAKKKTNKGEN